MMEMTMAVMVKMHNGDVERFDAATSYGQMADGYLELADTNGHRVALFAPGWAAAFDAPPRKTSSRSIGDDVQKWTHGEEIRQVAAGETSKALNALADSIGKRTG